MGKYLEVFKISWQQNLTYRLNFALWRIRNVMQLLLVYFIWWTVFKSQNQLFGYTISTILTYVLVAVLLRAVVLSTKVTDMIDSINSGSIVNFLVKPLGFIRYFLARDTADKLFNISFYIIEVSLFFLILKPPIIIQTNFQILIIFLLAVLGALIIYFCLNFIISLTAFWVENSWGPLFLMAIILEAFGGGLFPIDIFPKTLFKFLMLTPFPYLIYFPAKVYLGALNTGELFNGFGMIIIWSIVLFTFMKLMIRVGFRQYSAAGN